MGFKFLGGEILELQPAAMIADDVWVVESGQRLGFAKQLLDVLIEIVLVVARFD